MLEPPASFEEFAAVGGEVVHWGLARARGPVSLVAIGRSDLDALSHNFPSLANCPLSPAAVSEAQPNITRAGPEVSIKSRAFCNGNRTFLRPRNLFCIRSHLSRGS